MDALCACLLGAPGTRTPHVDRHASCLHTVAAVCSQVCCLTCVPCGPYAVPAQAATLHQQPGVWLASAARAVPCTIGASCSCFCCTCCDSHHQCIMLMLLLHVRCIAPLVKCGSLAFQSCLQHMLMVHRACSLRCCQAGYPAQQTEHLRSLASRRTCLHAPLLCPADPCGLPCKLNRRPTRLLSTRASTPRTRTSWSMSTSTLPAVRGLGGHRV